jgi:uncharacterized protein (DUF488 family)
MEIATIGYETATPTSLIAALRAAGVARVVDVRALANSRKPGTPAAGREAARSGRPEVMRRIFTAHLAGVEPQAALAGLRAPAGRERVCLLCLEADPARCHRTLVAEAIGLPVRHLAP